MLERQKINGVCRVSGYLLFNQKRYSDTLSVNPLLIFLTSNNDIQNVESVLSNSLSLPVSFILCLFGVCDLRFRGNHVIICLGHFAP